MISSGVRSADFVFFCNVFTTTPPALPALPALPGARTAGVGPGACEYREFLSFVGGAYDPAVCGACGCCFFFLVFFTAPPAPACDACGAAAAGDGAGGAGDGDGAMNWTGAGSNAFFNARA